MLKYITLKEAIEVHELTIKNSGGGTLGQLEINKLESVLTHIQNDDYYPTISDKLTHLFYCVCKFHCFQDGNKRLALTLSTKFLLDNGYLKTAINFIGNFEDITYYVACNAISKDLLRELIESAINNQFGEDEELKLKYINAIKDNLNDE